jgi:serine/threonine-protein kinase
VGARIDAHDVTPRARSFLRLLPLALWLGGGAVLAVVVFVFSFSMAMKMERRSTEVVVPELVGRSLAEAGPLVEPLSLVLEVVDQRHDPAVASGRILEQEPAASSRVRRGRKLKVVLSLGGKVLRVPDLALRADRTVVIELRRDAFAPGDQAHVFSSEVPAGKVVAQVPPAGTPAVPSTRVHRLVSDGPLELAWVMPDLTGRSRAEVERWLELCGFRRGPVRRVAARGHPPGTVVGQMPLAGYPVRKNDVVDLTVVR